MESKVSAARWNGLAVAGALLVCVGAAWFVVREFGIDPFAPVADAGWPYFVIIPGITLIVLSLVPKPPRGVGFAIAGAIVTTVGTVLLYQATTGHWESWAYAWALVGPGGAGLGMLAYGLLFRQRELVRAGARLVAIAAALFVAGYWYFETAFATGRTPIDPGVWWPVVIVAVGLAALLSGLARRGHAATNQSRYPNSEGGTR